MKRVASLLAPLLFGCGGVHSPGHPGDPLFEIISWLKAGPTELPCEVAIALQWERMPAEAVACLNGTNLPTCAGRLLPTLRSETLWSAPSRGYFTSSVNSIPRNALLEGEGWRFGYAYPVLYHDRNENLALDLVEPHATLATDAILASSLPSEGAEASLLFYCEGDCAASPVPHIFSMLGCRPASMPGFSLVSLSSFGGCEVRPFTDSVELALVYDTTKRVQQQMCVPEPPLLSSPKAPPPMDREVRCRSERVYEVVHDPEDICEQIERVEAPEGSALPGWWPCHGGPSDEEPEEAVQVSESFGPTVVRVWARQMRLGLSSAFTERTLFAPGQRDQNTPIENQLDAPPPTTSRHSCYLPMSPAAL